MQTDIRNASDASLKGIQHLFTSGPIIIVKWTESNEDKWVVDFISPNITLLGYLPEDFLEGKLTLADIIHIDDASKISSALPSLNHSSSPINALEGELRLLTAEGEFLKVYHYTVSAANKMDTSLPDNLPNTYFGYFIDLTNSNLIHTEKDSKIEYQAFHDLLTGLPNRNMFHDRLSLEVNRMNRDKKKFGLMFLDLDDFKTINDSLGHLMGDKLLQQAAERLIQCVRTGDTVARIGGDEFTILLPQIKDPREIVQVVHRILRIFKEPFLIDNHELYTTISIGICMYPGDGTDAVELLKNSDLAMYHAKEQGKNGYIFFSEKMNVQIKKRLDLENQLWHALREKQFLLHYQPVVEVKTGNIVGVEALIRWHHPDSGIIGPIDFIPIAEETGMILQLGQWILEASCLQNLEWQKQNIKSLYVSVNISSRQFARNDFIACIRSILKKTGLKTHKLSIQVTENGIMGNQEKIVRIMKELKKIGISLSIDDFGTGFSSLNHLRSYPVDTLKIDRSFISNIPHDPECIAIARSIINLAKNLNLNVLAEGVENEEQLDFLVTNGCDLMQGYYFSPPVPPEEIAAMILRKKNLYN